MATPKPYSYHAQLLLLVKALKALKEAEGLLDTAFLHEIRQLGDAEAGVGEYGLLARLSRDIRSIAEGHIDAVKALASMCPPDPVEPHDPTDYSEDERFQQMIDHAFDVAAGHGVEPKEVLLALATAVSEGDQR